MEYSDTYKTILAPSEGVVFKDQKSKFFGYAFPVAKEDEIKGLLEQLKRKHPSANHFCYAWRLGVERPIYRANDDGEPSNSAGKPIYGQILSQEITNVLVVVVRIFGGVKLGVPGLINAYRSSARMALEASKVVQKTLELQLLISFDYAQMNQVMRHLKVNKVEIDSMVQEMQCRIVISVPKGKAEDISQKLRKLQDVKVNSL